jgi:large subunit ribosomal protein L25
MSSLTLEAKPRTITGRKVRQIRNQGLVPVVVYGKTQEPVHLQVGARALERALHQGAHSQLLSVEVSGGTSYNVLVREIQRHPVTRMFLHADLYAVNMLEKQEVSVQVVGVGEPTELAAGLMVLQPTDSVTVSALPSDIPASIEVDISALALDHPITVANLPQVAGVEYLDDPAETLFTMIASRVEEEELEAPEGADAEPEIVGEESDEEEVQEESDEEE